MNVRDKFDRICVVVLMEPNLQEYFIEVVRWAAQEGTQGIAGRVVAAMWDDDMLEGI
tara:strand:+ start:587 stop:757 length:171 start_codon:yes stop_codon:yes gene_type:complete